MSDGVGLPSVDDGMGKLPPPLGGVSDDVPNNARGGPSESENAEVKKTDTTKQSNEAKEKDAEIIRRAVKRFKRCSDAESDNRGKALEDLKFKAGEQWDPNDQAERNEKKRPCIIINKIPTFTHQVANDIRQNRPSINISPLGEATKEGAELLASFVRGIERDSAADIAYDTAVGSAIDIGFGYWRILTEYESADSLSQVIVVRRVRNAFTILLDYARQEPDGSDARYGFVSEMVDRDDFKDQWPGAREVSWTEKTIGTEYELWATKDRVRVAEYFEVTHEKRRLVQLENGHIGYWDELDEAAKKHPIVNEREAEVQRVDWYRMTSTEILERQRWPGKWIPLIEVLGEEIDIEGKVIRCGIIRPAKDPQRMKNYWATTKTELYGLQPKAPWVGPEGSFEGFEDEWDRANRDNVVRLEYNPQYAENGAPLPAPSRQQPPAVAAGIVEAEKSAEQDMMGTTGVRFDATKSERTYDESGKAIRELRRSSDIGSYHYTDNFSRSLRHSGRVILDLIPRVYNQRRMVPMVAEDGKDGRMYLDPDAARPVGRVPAQQRTAEPIKVLNPTIGAFGVTVTTGPSYATKRIEAQENLAEMLGKVPEQMRGVIAALMAKYADFHGSSELYKALSKMLPPGILSPDLANLPPEVASMLQGMQGQIAKLLAERAQMIRDLSDQREDRAIARDKINKDFLAKVMKVFADLQKAADKNDLELLSSTLSAEEALTGGRNTTGDGGRSVGPVPGAPPGFVPGAARADARMAA